MVVKFKITIKLNRERYYLAPSTKYHLGIKIDDNLNWHHHVNDFAAKLNNTNVLFCTYLKLEIIPIRKYSLIYNHNLFTLHFLTHISTMLILYGLKILM